MRVQVLLSCAIVTMAMLVAACGRDAGHEAPAAKSATGDSHHGGHADASVVPGSYEDWCGEHQVAESQCTRCNPTLVAAFQATGDWCQEHGLPESQCLKCNPNLVITRPPKPAGS